MKNRAIYIEFHMGNLHWGKYFLNRIVGSVDSDSEPTFMCKKYFPKWKLKMRTSMKIALLFISSLLKFNHT